MKPLVIYHGNCVDGFTAAWAAWRRFGDEFEYYPASHGEAHLDIVGRDVVLLDFCYPRQTMVAMARAARSILVLDHHKSGSEDLYAGADHDSPSVRRLDVETFTAVPSWERHLEQVMSDRASSTNFANIYVFFDMARSGAGIAWDFFWPREPRPVIVDHVEDRDLWRFALPGTREIQAAVSSYPYSFAAWEYVAQTSWETLRDEGEAIERKLWRDVEELVSVCQRTMTIAGHCVPVANLPYTMASEAAHLMAQDAPFAACYWDTANGRGFSLRSSDDGLDVSEIARHYGGGGHRHAAGFSVPRDHELVRA